MTEFQDTYATVCSTSTLVAEDFSSFPPGTVVVCGPEISSTGNGCFPAGDLVPGFNITSAGPGDNQTVGISPGLFGNTDVVVGANFSTDMTIITFTEETFASGMIVYNNADTEFRVFDVNGDLLATYTIPESDVGLESFFGFISR